jgi:hypothetical protein
MAKPSIRQVPHTNPAAYAQVISASATIPTGINALLPTRAIMPTADGNITVFMAGDEDDVTFTGVKAGSVIPISIVGLKTGSDVVALW